MDTFKKNPRGSDRPGRNFSEKRSPEIDFSDNNFDAGADAGKPRAYKPEIVAELIGLDRDIMKLLVRRAKLVSKLRAGKEHAATPAAAGAEKEVRTAWEKNAVSFSRDDKFARQLFSLLQEVRVDSQADASARGAFNLAPSRRPVAVALPGPRSVTATRMFAVLAAWFGSPLTIENVLLNDPLMDAVKALNNAGAGFSWTVGARIGEGTLRHAPSGARVSLARDKALYIGEDLLTMYLMAFLTASHTGKARFTGGSGLKMADLTPLRRFLPDLGARLAHSVPKSNGLPGSVESSGLLPERITVPADLPREGVMALFCAAAAWRKKVSIDCAALPLPLFTAALAESLPVLRACSVTDGMSGTVVTLDATNAALPDADVCPLDPVLTAYLLALPVFAGGTVALAGKWEGGLPLAAPAEHLLRRGGLAVQAGSDGIRTAVESAMEGAGEEGNAPFDLSQTEEPLVPLGLALAARQAWRLKKEMPLPLLPESLDPAVAEGFYTHAGFGVRDGMLVPQPVAAGQGQRSAQASPSDERSGQASPQGERSGQASLQGERSAQASLQGERSAWTSPSPEWAFAYALCAYDSPNMRLANPTVVASLMPSFWALYNALPDPSEVKKAPEKEEKQRRRIRTQEF
ncbi:putative 5-enolpyruvylshikimate-3-phosphate synthase-like protein [uncultured delta proteobacterium]|uniref:Putative 5-enolpyruvylshikimate-3-phosphate synthase-like protein n=1 Tax=uncultured delta proteobacterium TaxID=34034 RepID=A0A212J846_9DELT|nr:putative 5-enolpyruvylshikimate-3-phosphate synthase-like protein [uncultured delta proteobacterium]